MRVRRTSAKVLWRLKRQAQARDRELLDRGAAAPETMIFLRPDRLKNVRIVWPKTSLRDVAEGERRGTRKQNKSKTRKLPSKRRTRQGQ